MLRRLERDRLVSRTVTPTIPPRVDYALTVDDLARWAIANRPAIVGAQQGYDARLGEGGS